ncbi:MAG: acyl-CoA dehydratase activase [Phycisphaerae bacterium]|jgi:predicted CoA-substrate-specific enzyme activase|nr:acyl-CoA dehydratase activase [Phycisphaerae bacterium]
MYIGLDIGSVSVNAVGMTPGGIVIEERYVRTHGRPVETARRVLSDMLSRTPRARIEGIGVTGTAGKLIAELLGAFFVNEIIAQSKASMRLQPEVRTVIELGGEDSKLILLSPDGATGELRMNDFAMNTVCAAGTGSFLDQQAARLGVSIEGQFGQLALKSEHPPRIAGRCSVFAKSDMIHLQQVATPDYDIVAGLCMALARNFKGTIAKGKDLVRPIAFHGGVAANAGMVRAFERVCNLDDGELIVPEYFSSMGAIGAVLALIETGHDSDVRGPEVLQEYLKSPGNQTQSHEPLQGDDYPIRTETEPVEGPGPVEAYLGVDVGSISTNLVVIDSRRRVLARRYLMTAGRPIEAVRDGLSQIGREIGEKVTIQGVCTTGSGRYLIGDFIGSDLVKNEITAHARGAVAVDPRVDTIFEIGGQDSKYVSLEDGAVVDFTMNKVCAAGTGSFLEEQAEKLGISIKKEFGQMALSSKSPARLGERCTVFIESDLNHHQQQGTSTEDLVAGLSYSIVLNYLDRVVEDRKIGDVIFFQGGTAYNRGVKAAFEKITGKKIIVPPHHDVLGALGSATIAMESSSDGPSRFKGFDLADRQYAVESFECDQCANHCEVRRVTIEGDRPLHYGTRCGRFDEEKRQSLGEGLPRLFAERQKMLMTSYTATAELPDDAPTVGIPRATFFWETFPFWNAFFTELGLRVEPSSPTNRNVVDCGGQAVAAETCFPIKVAHGHVIDLLQRGVDYLFLPCIVNMETLVDDCEHGCNCPYVQSMPYLARAAIELDKYETTVLEPVFHMQWGRKHTDGKLRELARGLGRRGGAVEAAIQAAHEAQDTFRRRMTRRGAELLAELPPDRPALVLISRPYNGCDPGLNLRIPDKLRELGAVAIPLDFLPIPRKVGPEMKSMYWRYGQRILAAAGVIARDPRLNAVYLTNFGCGPDSFIMKYFRCEMKGKPYLTIEVDEHSADAGAITRLEAFLDSLATSKPREGTGRKQPIQINTVMSTNRHRTVYIPHMDDHNHVLAAAMRHYGVRGEALPPPDAESLELGRRFTSGKECYPCILTTGDIVKKTQAGDFDPCTSCFFMATSCGPCRFGQYNRHHRMVLDELGLAEVPMVLLDQASEYARDMQNLGTGFRRLSWQSIVAMDYIKKLLLRTRPYELHKGDADRAYEISLDELCRQITLRGKLGDVPARARRRLEAVPVNRSETRPRIGFIGEIYVRSTEFSNNYAVRRIEALGGEAAMPAMQEWVDFIDWERKQELLRQRKFGSYVGQCASCMVQKMDVRRISRSFRGALPHFFHETPTHKVMHHASPYVDQAIRCGDTVLGMGRAVEYARHGFHGVVNLAPFNCLPSTIVNALLHRFSEHNPNVPILRMVHDGSLQTSEQIRTEAFMHQAHQAHQAHAATAAV